MPVRKFRNIEEMERPQWRAPGDPALWQAMAALWELGRRTVRRRYRPGVRKFRSIEEMSAAQHRARVALSGDMASAD